ncbi:hypothetical protein TNCV_1692581 [Trichonephila clavipes]|nr:hypothetical protein TNCV_1692581 [Trichonephila clavipes]
MWVEALSTAHLEQKNDLEMFAFPALERESLEPQGRTRNSRRPWVPHVCIMHLQTSTPSSGFEPCFNRTAVSVTYHSTAAFEPDSVLDVVAIKITKAKE